MTTRLHAALVAAATLALFAPSAADAQLLTRQPYLQSGSTSRMVIVWRTFPETDSVVRYGPDPQNLTEVVRVQGNRSHHEVELTGLTPDTRYYYSVGTGDTALATGAEYYFETAPPTGPAAPFRMWIVGDSGTGGIQQAAVRDAMVRYVGADRPDIYLHMGDMAYSRGEELEFDLKFYAPYQSILRNTVCWPTLGNHEGNSSDSGLQTGPYYEGYALPTRGEAGGVPSGTEAYYSFDYANAHFVVLDSHDSPREPDGAMLRWLRMDLENTDAQWLFAYWHHPPYTKGSHDSDAEGQLIDMRENALPILEDAGVDMVFGGHSHIYERTYLLDRAYDTPTVDPAGILDHGDGRPGGDGPYLKTNAPHEGAVYIVAGHGGTGVRQGGTHPMMFVQEPVNGSVLVDVNGNQVDVTNLRWDGEVSDWFTISKGPALTLQSPRTGDRLLAGDEQVVGWRGQDIEGPIRIELSLNGGSTWAQLTETDNDGEWLWTVPPGTETTRARMRLTAVDAPELTTSTGDFTVSRSAPRTVVTLGDTWSFHDSADDPGSEWPNLEYDDQAWPRGAAQLGYGDSDETTRLRDEDPNIPSYYFRHTFELDGDITDASFAIIHDDGAGVWINGTFVWGKYLASGLEHAAYASDKADDNELSAATIPLDGDNPFRTGTNVVAVMIKQHNEGSSDISFDFAMTLTVQRNFPPVIAVIDEQRVQVGESFHFVVEATDVDGDQLAYEATDLPPGASWIPRIHQFDWTPTDADVGEHTAMFEVTDGRHVVAATVALVVVPADLVIEPDAGNGAPDADSPDAPPDTSVPDASNNGQNNGENGTNNGANNGHTNNGAGRDELGNSPRDDDQDPPAGATDAGCGCSVSRPTAPVRWFLRR